MCGDYSYEGDYDGDWTMLTSRTVRLKARTQCDACYGWIEAGSYHGTEAVKHDNRVQTYRWHLQCRDVMSQMGWWGERVIVDMAQEWDDDAPHGPSWLEHHRAVAVWASGGAYERERAQDEIDGGDAR